MRCGKIVHSVIALVQKYGTSLYVFTLFAFVVAGLVYSFWLGDSLKFPDERLYLSIAENIAKGHGFSFDGITPTAFFPPVYPLILALFIKLGFSIPLLRFLNFIFLAASLVTIFSILKTQNGDIGIGPAAFLMGGYGVLFYTAGTFYPQTLFTFVLLLIVRVAIQRPFGVREAMIFGCLSAMLVLIHGTGVFVPPVVAIWLFMTSQQKKRMLKLLSISVLVAVICMSLWTFRNYKRFKSFIPLTTHGGDTLYIGNNPNTSISYWYDYVNDKFYQKVSRLPEQEQNREYVKRTLKFWIETPSKAIKLYFLKLIEYFNYKNNLCIKAEFSKWRGLFMFITYYPLLLCLVIRLLYARKIPLSDIEKLFVALYLVSAFFHALFLPRIRFRLPYDVILIAHIGLMFSIVARQCWGGREVNSGDGLVYVQDIGLAKKQISTKD
ncbi:MAG: hypothetical protein GXO58_01630 [Thermodesulfobacteria bacterium]|nr:hypothetical protein [Thermodesulfobacteriota bacterium]